MTLRQKKVRNFILMVIAGFAALIFALWLVILIANPGPEGRLVLASGGADGAYNDLAIVYQKQLAKYGVEVELRPTTSGSSTLRGLLDIDVLPPAPGAAPDTRPVIIDRKSDIDAGFIKGGVAGSLQGRMATDEERKWHDRQTESLMSAGRLFYEPIYVFYNGPDQVKSLAEFKGRKIIVGSKEGGARRIAVTLLNANGVTKKNATFVETDLSEDASELKTGKADVAFIVLPPESARIFKLMRVDGVFLMNFAAEADAYNARFPYLTKLVMHQGSIELAPDIPSADITLLATTAALVVKKSVHPAITALLADVVMSNPRSGFDRDGEPILFHKAGEFPSAKDPEFEVAREAISIYKTGDLPFVLNSVAPFNARMGIPFWVTAYLHKHGTSTALILIPLLSIGLPLARLLPQLYTWTVRRRLYQWYRQMKTLETRLDHHPAPEHITEARLELDRIDRVVSRVRVPINYSDQFYDLRGHIDLVRRRLEMLEAPVVAVAAE